MNLLSSTNGTITSAFHYSQVSGGGFFQSTFAGFRTFGDDGFQGSPELCERDHCGHGGGGTPMFLASQRFGAMGGAGTVPGMCCQPRRCGGFPGFPGGFPGSNGGFPGSNGGFPMMGGGFPGMNGGMGMSQQNPMMMMFMMMMMMAMMQQMMQGQRGGQGGPGGFPGGGSPIGMQPGQGCCPGNGQGQGQAIELQKGQSYTTPGGSTISWHGDEVKVHEAGGRGQAQGAGQGGGSFAFAMANGNSAFAMAGSFMGNPCCCCANQAARPRDWKVWGDPHMTNPDGSKHEDFSRKNGMFTLQDGTRVVIEADGPKGVTQKVKIFPPGAQLGGFNPDQTTNYTDRDRDGKWDNNGNQTVAQSWQGGNVSPFGNMLF